MFVGVHTIVANSSPFNMIVRGDSMTMHSSSGANESPWNRITLQPFQSFHPYLLPHFLTHFSFEFLAPFCHIPLIFLRINRFWLFDDDGGIVLRDPCMCFINALRDDRISFRPVYGDVSFFDRSEECSAGKSSVFI